MESITTFDPNREEGAYEALNQRIQQEVTDKPILANIVSITSKSLLEAAVTYLNLGTSQTVIKCLIQTYPSALLGTSDGYLGRTVFLISRHPEHCILMPWIATNYHWVLGQSRGPRIVFDLLDMYSQRRRNSCTSAILKDFFEAHPLALTQAYPTYDGILHYFLKSYNRDGSECEVDLFKWMAERCPSSLLLETDSLGNTPLHHACHSLTRYKGRDSCEICKYLIIKCPASVRIFNDDDEVGAGRGLPIHIIIQHSWCEYQLVREVVVCLLREYPESYDVRSTGNYRTSPPRSIPFIQRVKPHLDEEKELREAAISLTDTNSSLTKAVSCTNDDQLIRSASTVFDSWSTSFIKTTEHKLNLISVKLQGMCDEGHDYENWERQIQMGITALISSLH